jgi:hypothetical protein
MVELPARAYAEETEVMHDFRVVTRQKGRHERKSGTGENSVSRI